MDGFLIINKPAGITSFGVCGRIRKMTGTKKVGHCGTLDPNATGVLLVAVGKATRLLGYIRDEDKRYIADISFGMTSDTYDIWGDISYTEQKISFDEKTFAEVCGKFVGDITQVTPVYSAARVGGRHLYDYARRGEDVALPQRNVTINSIDIIECDPFSHARIDVSCSKGTYIRSLCSDIGRELGCGAVMAGLERVEACGFGISQAVDLGLLDSSNITQFLLPADMVIGYMTRVDVDETAHDQLFNGNSIGDASCTYEKTAFPSETLRVYINDRFCAIAEKKENGLDIKKNFMH